MGSPSHTSQQLFLAGAALLAAVSCAPGSEEPARSQPRLVILYATCTLNRDMLSPYAEDVRYTPSLDAFAKNAVVFDRHQTEAGQSGIAFASIFSGTQVDRHGIYHHPRKLDDDLYLITEAFRDAGYESFFWSGHPMAAHDLGYGQGVLPGNANQPSKGRRRELRKFLQAGDPMFNRVLNNLEEDPDYKAFLLVNFTVTHGAYQRQMPANGYAKFLVTYPGVREGVTEDDLAHNWNIYQTNRHALQWDFPATVERLGLDASQIAMLAKVLELTYQADVSYLDSLFGRTLARLEQKGFLEESLIAFTADHGETLYREDTLFHWTHGLQLAPEVLTVPWILHSPIHRARGMQSGRYAGVTRSIDVFPTIAGLCDLDLEGRGVEGTDLSGALLGTDQAPELLAYSHTTTIGPDSIEDFQGWGLASTYWGTMSPDRIWVRIRERDMVYKWINLDGETWGFRAFDLAVDPHETEDLFDPANARHREMAEKLRAYKALLEDRFGTHDPEAPDDAHDRLGDMGYVADDE